MTTMTSGDTGSGAVGVNLDSHRDGSSPGSRNLSGVISVGHTWAIPVMALAILWLFGTTLFRGL